ncbi:MAG TPA: acyl-CoA thioesterase [Oceanospirillales bacterium]|nr:acyl-CoA thioesterase [Oceanospirillales bacterium]
MTQLEKFNKKYAVTIALKVQWGDMDAFNHVNNIMYFRYFESARIAYFEKLEMMGNDKVTDVAPILAETSCRFKFPLTYPDDILVGARVMENHSHGFMMEYAVYSTKYKRITSIGTGRIVLLNYKSHEKVAVSTDLLHKIQQLENTQIQI